MSAARYDLVVLGSGPAGEKGAAQAAYFGKTVALVEKAAELGGAAANTGTLPSKTLRETALYLSGFHQRGLYGVTMALKDRVTARDFLYRERHVQDTERARIAENLQRHHVDLYTGTAAFAGPHEIQVTSPDAPPRQLTAGVVLVAVGSHPYRPPAFPFDDPRVYDSDTILQLHEIPREMVIVGGGVIGCEYACMFSALGVRVTLVEGHGRLLGFLDQDVALALQASMTGMGLAIRLNEKVTAVEAAGDLVVVLGGGDRVCCDAILVAAGRTGNTAELGLAVVGLAPDKRGNIPVNERYQTAVPHIYAAGDVIGFPALAATSMEQARVAMVHAFDLKYKTAVTPILPYGIYTIPECSMAGETEDVLQSRGVPYVAGIARYDTNARGQIIGAREGFLKLLFHRESMQLLGVHIIGESASELVHVGLAALHARATSDLFIQTCFNYPTLGELYKYATYDAMGRRARMMSSAAAAIHPADPAS